MLHKGRRGFTLTELLVVLAVIGVISGLLFPVFASVRGAANRTTCLSNFRQVSAATMLYSSDYDDRFEPVNHQPAETPNSRNDHTWVQLLLPYVRSFAVFQCPSDKSPRPRTESTFDQDLVSGDLYSQYYTASLHVNLGYNFQYLAPIFRSANAWMSRPKAGQEIPEPARTLEYVDSVWSLNHGQPEGGGSWLVSPPCRYEEVNGQRVDTFKSSSRVALDNPDETVYAPVSGWQPDLSDTPNAYGGAWPWHMGRMNIALVDGHAKAVTLQELSAGCNVRSEWKGEIFDSSQYLWYSH